MLPPYNENPICPKCWSQHVAVFYCQPAATSGDVRDRADALRLAHHDASLCTGLTPKVERAKSTAVPTVGDEHLHRQCERCRFEWLEACASSPLPPPPRARREER